MQQEGLVTISSGQKYLWFSPFVTAYGLHLKKRKAGALTMSKSLKDLITTVSWSAIFCDLVTKHL